MRYGKMVKILQGQAVALFAFDIGYEVSLEQVRTLLSSIPIQPISRKKKTPNYLQYTKPPQVLNLGETDIFPGHLGQIQATVFDFGAISIAYRWSLSEVSLVDLPEMSQALYSCNLEEHAKEQVQTLMQKIQSAIIRPELSTLIEDYYIFVLEKIDTPLDAKELLAQHRSTLAQMLHFDTQTLSPEQQAESLNQAVSYYINDLVLVDWNAALIYDPDYTDTLNILELLNIELLEARYIDAQLDQRLKNYEGIVQKSPEWPLPLRTPYRKAIEDLAELRIESALLSERVDNSLKLIGDLYLARIHNAASKQFHLQDWETAIARKLDIIDDLYQLLSDRANHAQNQTLELIIIGLILIEIFMTLFYRG
jgi:hypothetical protein